MTHSQLDEREGWFMHGLGAVLLVTTFLVSLVFAIHNSFSIEHPDKTVLRIAHWQLERGYREAMAVIISDYEKVHPDVEIQQNALSDQVYGQSINVQLISGTAADICELGVSDLLTQDQGTALYFLSLGTPSVEPNPYNAGTSLQGVRWRDTLLDGMRGGYREGLADYFGVSTTITSTRLYYNRGLLKAATGSDQPPATFGQWMRQCQAIRSYAAKHDPRIVPVVSCRDVTTMLDRYQKAFTSSQEPAVDLNLDGDVTARETYVGYLKGVVSLDTPEVRAAYETMRTVGTQMQQGFSAMDRQQAQYRFVNGLAAFMWTGSWDASSTLARANDVQLDVGITRLPMPGPGDDNFQLIHGAVSDDLGSSCSYGVARCSAHPDLAIDFLRFLTSQAENQKLNQLAQWPPITIGAEPSSLMRPFAADRRGYSAQLMFMYGSRVAQDTAGVVINYLQGDASYSDVAHAFDESLKSQYRGGDWAWSQDYTNRLLESRDKERLLARQQTLDLLGEPVNPQTLQRLLLQQVTRNDAQDDLYDFRLYRGRPLPEY